MTAAAQHGNTTPPLLLVEHLTMRFGGLVAIDDVSFAAPPAQITAIIGPNGAGKTTVFNCLTGFYKPSVGRLTLNASHGVFLLEQIDDYGRQFDSGVFRDPLLRPIAPGVDSLNGR